MKRLNLSIDDRLFDAIQRVANAKGILPTALVVGSLEDLYLKDAAVDYDGILMALYQEAQAMPRGIPFLLSELPSFSNLIIVTAARVHISPSTIRARIGKSFNAAVRAGKVKGILRAKRSDGRLLNKAGVAMYIGVDKEKQKDLEEQK